MSSYRILVRSANNKHEQETEWIEHEQGTAWLAAEDLVFTAFHVVGSCDMAKWAHEEFPDRSYWIQTDTELLILEPIAFDAYADIALLRCGDQMEDVVLALAEFCRNGVEWKSVGFPGFYGEGAFTISGKVISVAVDHETGRAIQLSLDQGAEVDWAGVSGSAVIDNGKTVALITNVTHKAATAWAAPVTALRRLLMLSNFLVRVRECILKIDRVKNTNLINRLACADQQRATEVLNELCEFHPEIDEITRLKAEFSDKIGRKPYLGMPSSSLAILKKKYDLIAEREHGRRFLVNPIDDFKELFFKNQYFGGRKEELARLDKLVAMEASGYCFVTGNLGYGKTSLLTQWIEMLRRRGDLICFHFFNGLIEESLDPRRALSSLCKQLLSLHLVGGELPDTLPMLQSLFSDLIRLPSPDGRLLVIILAGLDEVTNTLRPGPLLFPRELGDGVHIVLSAVDNGRDWFADFGLKINEDHVISVKQLGRSEIGEVITNARITVSDTQLDELLEKTNGDPFYVGDILQAIVKSGGKLETLKDLKENYSEYLAVWWKQALKRISQPAAFTDLMGILAALHAPLSRDDLMDVCFEDDLKPATLDLLLDDAERYVQRDINQRYCLKHPRMRHFVEGRIHCHDMEIYKDRLIRFCQHWNNQQLSKTAREYGRIYGIAHLLEKNRFIDALNFLDGDLMAGKWLEEGSYRSLLDDFDRLLSWIDSHPQNQTAVCAAPAIAITSASAHDLMRNLPDDWYRAKVRFGQYEKLRDLLDTLPLHRGEARYPLLAVADELSQIIDLKIRPLNTPKVIVDLIRRTIDLLPLVRTNDWKLETIATISRLLASDQLDERDVDEPFRQLSAFIKSMADQTLRAYSLAHLAQVVFPVTRNAAEKALLEAERIAESLKRSDSLEVHIAALQAHRKLRPDTPYRLLVEDLNQLTGDVIGSFAHVSPSLHELFKNFEPFAEERDALFAFAQRSISSGSMPNNLAIVLYRTGRRDLAWQVVDLEGRMKADTEAILFRLNSLIPVLSIEDLVEAEGYLDKQFQDGAISPRLVAAFAKIGRWTDCINCLDALDSKKTRTDDVLCLEQALLFPDTPERDHFVDYLIKRVGKRQYYDARQRADDLAHLALLLARSGHRRAKELFWQSTAIGLSQLPEGDSSSVRLVTALSLALEGKVEKAERVSLACKRPHQRIASLRVAATGVQGNLEFQRQLALTISEVLSGEPCSTREQDSVDIVTEAYTAAMYFAPILPEEAKKILHQAERRLKELPQWSLASCYLGILKVRIALGQTTRSAVADKVLSILERENWLSGDLFIQGGDLILEALEPSYHMEALSRLQRIPEREQNAAYKIRIWSAYAAILAKSDSDEAMKIFSRQIEALEDVAKVQESKPKSGAEQAAINFCRLINELDGGLAKRAPGVKGFEDIVSAITHTSTYLGSNSVEALLGDTWNWISTTKVLADAERCAAAAILFESLIKIDTTTACRLSERVSHDLLHLLTNLEADQILAYALHRFACLGRGDAAEVIHRQIRDPETREKTRITIDLFNEFYSLEDQSLLEKTLFEHTTKGLEGLSAGIIIWTRKGKCDSKARYLALETSLIFLKENLTRRKIFDRIPPLILPVVSHWGADAALSIVDLIDDFDNRLMTAASRLATSEE